METPSGFVVELFAEKLTNPRKIVTAPNGDLFVAESKPNRVKILRAGADGTLALIWGGEDIVSLAKEIIRIAGMKEFAPFGPKGGVMEGQRLSADEVQAVSKWPSRQEQLSILSGQFLSPGAMLSAQLVGIGKKFLQRVVLAAQFKKQVVTSVPKPAVMFRGGEAPGGHQHRLQGG